jgi:DNA mismatch repair protein MutL
VNGRFVRNRTLSHALDEAYRATLPSGRFPFAVLLIETDPAVVDVNVHPTKAQVRFLREWEFHRALNEAVKSALGPEAPPPGTFAVEALVSQDHLRHAPWTSAGGASRSWSAPPLPSLPPDPNDPFADPPLSASVPAAPAPSPAQPLLPETAGTASLRPVAQIWSSYILAEGPTGLVIIDQHLAHERILFDRLLAPEGNSPPPALETPRQREDVSKDHAQDRSPSETLCVSSAGYPPEAGGGASSEAGGDNVAARPAVAAQRLAVPLTLTLARAQAMLVEENLEELRGLGFDVEAFGRDAFVVRAVPAFVRPGQERALLHEMLEEMGEGLGSDRPSPRRDRVAAAAACRAAIKKGERLAREEITRLLEDLARTSNPHTCPHGCPIAVEISYQELLKRFKRV